MVRLLGDYTPLMLAAETGDLEALQSSDSLDAQSAAGLTALAIAVKNRQNEAVKKLLALGSSPHTVTRVLITQAGQSIALLAVASNNLEGLRLVAGAGCDVNLPDSHGWSPLLLAVSKEQTQTVAELVRLGADVRYTDKWGRRAADRCKNQEIARMLAVADVDVSYKREIQELEEQRSMGKSQLASLSMTQLPEVAFSRYESETRFTRDMLRYATTGLIANTAKRVSVSVQRGKELMDKELKRALTKILSLVDRVVSQEAQFMYERLRHEMFVEVDNAMRMQGVATAPSRIKEVVPEVVLKQRAVQPVLAKPWTDSMISRLYSTPFSRNEDASVDLSSGVHKACAVLVEHYSLQLYEHLSTIVGEEAWHMIADATARLRKTVDNYIAETLEEVQSQLVGALQKVLQQRVSELLD